MKNLEEEYMKEKKVREFLNTAHIIPHEQSTLG